MKNVALFYNGANVGPQDMINVKNIAVGERIAGIIGGTFDSEEYPETYHIPLDAVLESDARRAGIRDEGDLYGGIVRRPEHADKAMLHMQVATSAQRPDWYEPAFAARIQDVVLPGYTVFSSEDALRAYDKLAQENLAPRIKDPGERCERGQISLTSKDVMVHSLSQYPGIESRGAVVEADLRDASTIAVGYVAMGGVAYCWFGKTWEVDDNGIKKFGGNELTVVRGSFADLSAQTADRNSRQAVQQTGVVFDAYSLCGAAISRATFDVVQGAASNGEFLSGVTDPSIRPSASSPAEIKAIEIFGQHPDAAAITTRVTYDYGKKLAETSARELFAANHKNNVFVEVIEVAA
jgi:hypothetical protein